ncbi:hypothetical protein GGX14DRAFT_652380 [Mycena pura]|uniref:Alpha-type protein kinase domain-containing protein n=1 Tax=Mycena pura TaxID=153505 RepID=A0AAD6Y5T9_9AGAR|nr:hypothetical protein GGX14DRAFT_652380 [Mycena pura]
MPQNHLGGNSMISVITAKSRPEMAVVSFLRLCRKFETPHSTIGTLGQFFNTQERIHGNHPKKILQGPTTLRLPSPAIYLEGLIAVTEFENATGTPAPYFAHTDKEIRKRKASRTAPDPRGSEFSSSRCIRSRSSTPHPLRSDFGDVPGFSKLDFVFASVSFTQDGTIEIDWPALLELDESTVSKCLVQDKPFDQGKTKMVILDGLPWVGKRFFNIGTDCVMEATRLARANYFVERFLAEAKRQDVEHGIRVTAFKLAVEIVPSSGPSAASGFSLEQYEATQPPVVTDGPAAAQTVVDENGGALVGVGDHGKPGIETLLKKHTCVNRCAHLGLSREGFESDLHQDEQDSE